MSEIGEAGIRERENLKGDLEGILIVVNEFDNGRGLDEIRHQYQGNITTRVHSHMNTGKCLDLFLVGGDALVISEI